MRFAWHCDGCGELIEFDDPKSSPPAGWLFAPLDEFWRTSGNRWDAGPWTGTVSTCSADCVAQAKANVKLRADKAVERYKRRIDAAVMERVI